MYLFIFYSKQDQASNRYDSILHWLQLENATMSLTYLLGYSHTPNLEMLSHLKIIFRQCHL